MAEPRVASVDENYRFPTPLEARLAGEFAGLVAGKVPVGQIPTDAIVTDSKIAEQVNSPQTGMAIDNRINVQVTPVVEQITADYVASNQAVIDAAAAAVDANPKINTLETNRFFRGHNLVSDLNLATEQGRYTFGSLPTNAPTTALGDVDVHVTGTTIVQDWTTLEASPRTLQRRRLGGTWGAWVDSAERSMQGRGILAPNTSLNTLCLPQHNGDYALSQDNWAGYLDKPSDAPATGVRGTVGVNSPNNWTVMQELHINTGTVYWLRTMLSPTGPVFNPWRRIDTSLIGTGGGSGGSIEPLPTADWVHWGDSLTDDEALGADAWVTKLAALTGKIHDNEGWYGQQAAQIAARQGGNPALMTIPSGTIPSSGTQVGVLAANPHVSMPVGAQQPTRQVPGKLAGRTGYLVDGGATAQDGFFMPTDGAGASIATGVHQFIPTGIADSGRRRVMTVCVGENDIWATGPSPQHVAYMARQMNDYQNTNVKRVLVLSIPRRSGSGTGTVAGDKVTAINDALKAELPSAFVDLAGYMMSDQAAVDAGITYSADDLTDIAEGVTPRVFRLPSDSVHFNALGCSIISPFVYAAARDRGWVS